MLINLSKNVRFLSVLICGQRDLWFSKLCSVEYFSDFAMVLLWWLAIGLFLSSAIYGQKRVSLAFLIPDKSSQSNAAREKLEDILATAQAKIPDDAEIDAVLKSNPPAGNLYNLSTEEAQTLGSAAGCNFLVILKAENLRRTSLSKGDYYESYMAVYIVSTRTGRLVFWTLKSFEAPTSSDADKKLLASLEITADEIAAQTQTASQNEINETPLPKLEELPEENSPEAKNFRSPLPYKRLRPAYTPLANLYSIAATVDALVDLDETGKITRIEITRWAGYGLDESVIKTIREMNWREASRDGKPLPVRVLLRYNFKKIEKEE